MKHITKYLIGMWFLIIIPEIFAQQAILRDLSGTVELKFAGSSVWETARKGQSLAEDTIISTGFKSTALIQAGSSLITVRPLTRMILSELRSAAGTETINVGLQTGRVRVDVKPPAGTKTTMSVSGPIATASVRGTVFEFDTINLIVSEGTVEFLSGTSVTSVLIDAGRSSFADEQTGRAALPEETALAELKPELPIGTEIIRPIEQSSPENTVTLNTIVIF